MKRKNATRHALFTSIVSLLLCVSMLVGTTFAWFTDSVESGYNTIAAGNLDVELNHADKGTSGTLQPVSSSTVLFDDVTLWEPGAALYETLQVMNAGTLALKYNLNLNVLKESVVDGYKLSDVIMVGKIDGELATDTTREGLISAVSEWTPLNAFSMKENGVELEVEGSDEFTVVLYWQPNNNEIDNRYNVKNEALNIEIGVVLTATQVEAESDSFGDDYDAGAKVPGSSTTTTRTPVNSDGSVSLTVVDAPAADTKRTTVDAPAGAFTAGDEVEIKVTTVNTLFNVTADGGSVAALDVTLSVNGNEVTTELEDGKVYTVTTYISKNLTDVKVEYTGTDGKDQPTLVSYDAETGKLVFTTNHFSNYAVYGAALAYDAKNDTAVNDIEEIVEAAKDNDSTVVIPEANKEAVTEKIDEAVQNGIISEADKNVIDNALMYVAKIGKDNFTTVTAAFAAVEDGETITLLNDVHLDTIITNTKKITLDLNGKTVTGVDNTSKNFSLIDNRSELTITGNGTMTLKATVNSGWNRYSAVLANNPGGKLVIANGTFEHLGGTDMAYGIDNLTNGKGTYAETVINGGTVKSPYRAIRQFLNGIEAQNILTINAGTIEGANKSVWMQDPSKNANSGTLTVTENAVLNGDVYLFVTAGSTEWPVTVSIAEEAVNGEVLSGNVPAGYEVRKVDGCWTVVAPTKVSTEAELRDAVKAGGGVMLADDITLTKTLMAEKDVVIDLNGYTVDANMSQNTMFQSQSNAKPSMIITSSKSGAEINAGGKSVLLGYGSTEFYNVEINVGEIKSSSYTTFNVYGDLTLGEGTVVNVGYLGTALISNNGSVDIDINGAEINVGTFKVNGGAMISLTQGTTLALKDTEVEVGLDTTYTSYFITKAEGATIEKCTFNVTDTNNTNYDIKLKPDANVGARYAWVQK